MAAGLLLLRRWSWQDAALLAIAIWSFCRFYYFVFYVIQHYVDPGFRYAGLGDFVRRRRWQVSRRRKPTNANQNQIEGPENEDDVH